VTKALLPTSLRHAFTWLFAALSILAMACSTVPRQRTLPPSVRSAHLPVFVNRSPEPGLEEVATVYAQEEFLADGRINIVPLKDADILVNVTLTDFSERGVGKDADDFARVTEATASAKIDILRNAPGKPKLGKTRYVQASGVWQSDARRISYEPEPIGRERLLRELARQVVQEVLTGKIEEPGRD